MLEASAQAQLLGHSWIGCEHLLLGLAAKGGPVADVLRRHGLTEGSIRSALQDGGPSAAAINLELEQRMKESPWTPRAGTALVLADMIAERLRAQGAADEHLMLALCRLESCVVSRVLLRFSPDVLRLEEDLLAASNSHAAPCRRYLEERQMYRRANPSTL